MPAGVAALALAGTAVSLRAHDATTREGGDGDGEYGELRFRLTLSHRHPQTVSVDFATSDGTATAGEWHDGDYSPHEGTIYFWPGTTEQWIEVAVMDDAHDEGTETMHLTLSNARVSGDTDGDADTSAAVTIARARAVGTIVNDDPIPGSWTARLGRTVGTQVLDAIEARMRASPDPGAQVRLAGGRLDWQSEAGDWIESNEGGSIPPREERTMAASELLRDSAFSLTSQTSTGALVSLWGSEAVSHFDGRDGALDLDGEVATAMLGTDWTRARVTGGLIVGHSKGDGGYRRRRSSGNLSSTLTGLYPWGRYEVSDRVTAWGAAGWAEGTLELTNERNGARRPALRADLPLAMGAGGLRGTWLDGGEDGLTLTAKTDAFAVRTTTGRVTSPDTLTPSRATVTRVRLGLEASRPVPLGHDGTTRLTPSLELAARADGGDAETGLGIDVGAGVAVSATHLGLEAQIRARGLLMHETGGLRDRGLSGQVHWRARPGSDRGATFTLTQTVGGLGRRGSAPRAGDARGARCQRGGSTPTRGRARIRSGVPRGALHAHPAGVGGTWRGCARLACRDRSRARGERGPSGAVARGFGGARRTRNGDGAGASPEHGAALVSAARDPRLARSTPEPDSEPMPGESDPDSMRARRFSKRSLRA